MIPKSCRLFGKDHAASKIPKVADFLVKITRQNKNIETMCDQGLVHHCRLFGKACEKPSPKSKFILNSLDGIIFALKEFSAFLLPMKEHWFARLPEIWGLIVNRTRGYRDPRASA